MTVPGDDDRDSLQVWEGAIALAIPLIQESVYPDISHIVELTDVATNHSAFERPETLREILALASEECLLVDPWNTLGTAQVFAYGAEAAALLGHATSVDTSPDPGH